MELLFGRTRTGFSRSTGMQWWIENSEDGKIKYWNDSGLTGSGKSWVEGDLYCDQWQKLAGGKEKCGYIYCNPDGTPEKKNEYLSLKQRRITPWSLVDRFMDSQIYSLFGILDVVGEVG